MSEQVTQSEAVGDGERRALEEAKRASVPQLLFKCARVLNDQSLARLREVTGKEGLRPAHTGLFPHIDLEGTRLTTLAERMGISKQAVAQLASELVEMELLERVPDPSDGRAKLIRFAGGTTGLLHGLQVLAEIESELAEEIGAEEMRALHRILLKLHDALERRGEDEPADAPPST